MTTSSTAAPQHSQFITEEWMMMHPPSSHVVPPTFLEIMFLKETEQYIYTNVLPTLFTEIHTKYIQPLVHRLLVKLQLHQQLEKCLSEDTVMVNDANESSIHTKQHFDFKKAVLKLLHRIKKNLRTVLRIYILPFFIRIVAALDTICHSSNCTLEIIYLLRYILDRYTLIQYNCTLIESLYGGGNMMRKKVGTTVASGDVLQQHQHSTKNNNSNNRTILLPLNHNDHIRTALLTNLLGYTYEKLLQIRNHSNRDDDHGRPSTTSHILYSLLTSIYQLLNNCYFPYQYLIGTSYYMNLPNRLLHQILLQRPQTLPSSIALSDDVPTNRQKKDLESVASIPISVPTTSSLTWYITVLRTSGVVLWSSCYVIQMIQYYFQRRRTLRQERLLERQQRQPLIPQSSITIVSLTNTKVTDGCDTIDNGGDCCPQQNPDDEASSLQILMPLSDGELLPVPLLPDNFKNRSLWKSYIKKGYCPICNQPIHRSRANSTETNVTMLFGYVYCSYTCIHNYLLDNNGICPMTGRTVEFVQKTNTTTIHAGNDSSTAHDSTHPTPPQLIRLL
jgi:hypothetical protein